MKKTWMTGLLAVALVATVGITPTLAAGNGHGRNHGVGSGLGWVDTNGDGVCDNLGQGGGLGSGLGWVDADGDGVCDNLGQGGGQGRGCGGGRCRW